MKKYAKWVSVLILTPFLLILLLTVLLYLPPVQNWAVKQVAYYASESTGMIGEQAWIKLKADFKFTFKTASH